MGRKGNSRWRAFNQRFTSPAPDDVGMVGDPEQAVTTLRERLTAGNRGGCDRDRELLLEFSDELKVRREDYGHYRHEKLLRHCVRMSEHAKVCLHDSLTSRRDGPTGDDEVFEAAKDTAKAVVRWIHDTYDVEDGSQETNRDYRVAFRLLAKHTTRGDSIPDTHSWISTKTTRDYQPTPDEADMLDRETDVEAMIDAARNPRDRALIALQFEAGLRGGELYDLRRKYISDGEHALKVRVDGKRGEHDVHLIWAVPWVQSWLTEHPGDQDDYLWSKLSTPGRVSYQQFLKSFRECASRAGVEKPVTPTNFRKSNAYWLATREKSQAFIEDRQGRARGSPVISRYVAKFTGETAERQYAAMHGLDVETESTEPVAPISCPRCGLETPRGEPFCNHCHQAVDHEATAVIDTLLGKVDDRLVEADDAEEREQLIRIRRTVNDEAGRMTFDDVHELASELSLDTV